MKQWTQLASSSAICKTIYSNGSYCFTWKKNDKVMEILVIMKYVPLFLKHLSAINVSS